MQDRELLTQFAQTRSQDAFAQLVRRYMGSVYSASRRQVRDSQLAQDVAQAVFIILARKAGSLKNRESLAGWIMKTTHLASLDALRAQSRRRRHEQRAAFLAQWRMEQSMASPIEEIAPELDRAMSRLSESDRSVVTLRYLQGKTTGETGECLGISEPAAAKRITRAVDRLRKILFAKRAIVPTVALAVLLDQIPRVPAPAALVDSAVHAATTGAVSPAGLSIAKGVLHMMTFHKILVTVVLLIIFAGIGTGTVKLLADQSTPPDTQMPDAKVPVLDQPQGFTARLSNGVSIEILGIGESPSTGKQWWLPNGDLLNIPPYARIGHQVQAGPRAGCVAREIAVKVHSAINGSDEFANVEWDLTKNLEWGSSDVKDKNGREIPDMLGNAYTIPDNPGGATIHAKVAAGEWNTRYSAQAGGYEGQSSPIGQFFCSRTFLIGRETHIVVAYDGRTPGQEYRLIAVDRNGKLVPAETGNATVGNTNTNASFLAEFSVNLPQKSIREWQFQSRPFDQWIEIRGISLHPGEKMNVMTVTSDDQQGP